jgi:hypothetical protein
VSDCLYRLLRLLVTTGELHVVEMLVDNGNGEGNRDDACKEGGREGREGGRDCMSKSECKGAQETLPPSLPSSPEYATTHAKILPTLDVGTTSPYPTVVAVMT